MASRPILFVALILFFVIALAQGLVFWVSRDPATFGPGGAGLQVVHDLLGEKVHPAWVVFRLSEFLQPAILLLHLLVLLALLKGGPRSQPIRRPTPDPINPFSS